MQVLVPTSLVLTDVRVILDTVERIATSILMNASHHLADMVSETFFETRNKIGLQAAI